MKNLLGSAIICIIVLSACSTSKSYFTEDTRAKVEASAIPVSKLQFYIDKDVELRRELASGDAKVKSGKVIIENGKYINIILLKKGTAGVCTRTRKNSLHIAFEPGENKDLRFTSANRSGNNAVYLLDAEKWMKPYNSAEVGKIAYDGDIYFMRFNGDRPKLMIKKSSSDNYEVNKRVMTGRKVN